MSTLMSHDTQVRLGVHCAWNLQRYGHRREVRRIVSDVVIGGALAAVTSKEKRALEQDKSTTKSGLVGPHGNHDSSGDGRGRVSLRALLGDPPYGTV